MKVAIIGSDTNLGQKIVLECEENGIATICVQESPLNLVGNGVVILKAYDNLRAEDLAKCYAVIDVLSFDARRDYRDNVLPYTYLNKILDSSTRLIVAAPALCLYIDKQRLKYVYESVDQELSLEEKVLVQRFEQIKNIARKASTMLCQPLIIDEENRAKSCFKLCDDILPVDLNGSSLISINDYARAFIEVIKDQQCPQVCSCYGCY